MPIANISVLLLLTRNVTDKVFRVQTKYSTFHVIIWQGSLGINPIVPIWSFLV